METQYLFKGSIKVSYGATAEGLEEKILQPGEKIDISPKTIHRIEALEDSEIFEVSTPELDDIVKLADDYGRTGKGNDEKKDEILSGQKNM